MANFPKRLLATVGAAALALPLTATYAASPADPDRRAREVLARMTREEKIALLHGRMLSLIAQAKRPEGVTVGAGFVEGVPRLGIPPQVSTDASLGVSNLLDMRRGDVATALPSGLALAATWDPGLVREGGRMIGSEARAKGFNVMLAGGVNLVRDPRSGRNFEYLGEDPLLAGTLAGAQIDGVQSNHVVSTIKHFALNDQEIGRSSASVQMDEAAMRESDLLAFEIGIEKGNPGAVMCGYNKIGGTYSCENPFLLTQVLRSDWGFKGFVMSDWGAVHSLGSLQAGLDQQQGEQIDAKRWLSTELVAALDAGRVPESAVDIAALRILRTLYAHGLDTSGPLKSEIDFETNGAIARRAAEEGIVMLRNPTSLLPIAASVQTIAVIGGHADIGVLSGGGSSQVAPVGGFRKIEPVRGGPAAAFGRKGYGGTPPLDAIRASFPTARVVFVDGADPEAAAKAARSADIAIVFGEKHATEADDQRDLSLDAGQDALIDAVTSANPRSVVVLETGNAVVMPWAQKAGAILVAWFPGQHGGEAIADVLAGKVNPSGRLPVTFPTGTDQLPNPVMPGSDLPPPSKDERITYGVNTNSPPFEIRYPEGSDVGYRWFDRQSKQPAYAFGYGLSYTTFTYSDLTVEGGKTLSVRFAVTNAGTVAGADVPQVYVRLEGKAKRLIGWQKVRLAPGEKRIVTLKADRRLLGHYDTARQRWAVPAGRATVELARSANDPVLTSAARISAATILP
ncbi:glycoside hydrolase family 3 C-terminal domain-containing protein [Novosphingobium sp. P6W]|uniref:glycoside hydrolase family 3 C-terminal domain-containing protein n=1 Tax=Novosphingobium sp. P6W TaxID=1609758 RepID=UPI0005C2CDCC|nr:glycoside hydrolase family 3 C-terminal domain-containing protein [Novosphingobium sp. P6W]AXB80580.1 glycosyl hydrolase [Novosphingobium sp. P6W]KIS29955.1 beta-glucosidase [Novosphingobium sp. P6W]